MPSKTIVDFANQVKSYALGIKDQQVLGAWNLFNNTAVSQTVANVPITVNADKSMLLNGTATGNIRLNLGSVTLKAGTYYLSGGANSDFYLNIINTAINSTDYDGTEFTVTEETTYSIQLVENGTKTASNLVVKPMISTQPNQPYVPNVMTNRELTDRFKPINETISIPVTASENVNFVFSKIADNIVFVTANNTTSTTGVSTSWTELADFIPVKFRPTQKRYFDMILNGANFTMQIDTNGTLKFKSSSSSAIYIQGTTVYNL